MIAIPTAEIEAALKKYDSVELKIVGGKLVVTGISRKVVKK